MAPEAYATPTGVAQRDERRRQGENNRYYPGLDPVAAEQGHCYGGADDRDFDPYIRLAARDL